MRAAALLMLLLWTSTAGAGTLTTKAELLAYKANPNSHLGSMMSAARQGWRWGTVSGDFESIDPDGAGPLGKVCRDASNANADYLLEGAPDALAQAIGAVLTTDSAEATALAAAARINVLDLIDTTGFGGELYSGSNECILDLGTALPTWIEAAQLLAEIGGGWSAGDTTAFREWLAGVYPKVAWASRVRRNNWGAAGSLSAWLIARYLDPSTTLNEVSPGPPTISTAVARAEHRAKQLERIGTSWEGDSQCSIWGIRSHGGIPDELRRGSTGCLGTFLADDDSSRSYQTMHVELLVFHMLALSREGDWSLVLPSILQSFLFVIDNSNGLDWAWDANRYGAVKRASYFFQNSALNTAAAAVTSFRGGRTMPWQRVLAVPPQTASCP